MIRLKKLGIFKMIFIGEDIQERKNSVQVYLSNANLESKIFSDSSDVINELKDGVSPALFIFSKNFLTVNEAGFIKKIREEYNQNAPIIIISETGNEDDILTGFEIGADDFLAKPFSQKIFLAHVNAQLRRTRLSSETTERCFKFGEFSLLLDSNVLKKNGEKIPLSTKEYAVLEYMTKNVEKTLSPAQIYENVWKTKFGDITAVAVYIQRLRKKIENDPANPVFIKTIFGQGYSFSRN